MGDSTLATFRIEQSLWDEFKLHCSQNGDSASSRLIKLMMSDMGKSETLTPLDNDIDKRIESYLESHLDKFIDKMSRTDIDDSSIQRLDSRIDSLREEISYLNDGVKQAIANFLTNQNNLVPLDYDEGIYLKAFAVDYLGLIDPEEIELATEKLYECGQHTVKLDNLGILEQFRTELVENWQIRHKDNYTTYRCFPVDLERAINWRAKRWGIIHRDEFFSTIEKINNRINVSVPLKMFVSNTIEDSLTPILARLNRLENYETIQVLSDDPSDFSEETPKSEPEGITASTLAPIFDEPENNPLDDSTPENDVSPVEEKTKAKKGKIKGKSIEVTDENTNLREKPSLSKSEMASLLGIPEGRLNYRIQKAKDAQGVGRYDPIEFVTPDGVRYIYEKDTTAPSGMGAGHPKRFRKV